MAVKKYDLLSEAENDLEHIIDWYERQSAGLGIQFLDEFGQCLKKIMRNPKAFKLVDRKTRRYLMKTFPYTIFYGIRNEILIVARVRSNRQKPLKRYY